MTVDFYVTPTTLSSAWSGIAKEVRRNGQGLVPIATKKGEIILDAGPTWEGYPIRWVRDGHHSMRFGNKFQGYIYLEEGAVCSARHEIPGRESLARVARQRLAPSTRKKTMATVPPIPPELLKIAEPILSSTALRCRVSVEDIRGRGKATATLSRARRIATALLRDVGHLSWTEIGTVMNRDHSTSIKIYAKAGIGKFEKEAIASLVAKLENYWE